MNLTTTPHYHVSVLTAVGSKYFVLRSLACRLSLPRHTAYSPSQVRFGLLHTEIEPDGGRGAEQQDGETDATIGSYEHYYGLRWHEMARKVECD